MGAHSMYEVTFSHRQVRLMVPLQPVTIAASEVIAVWQDTNGIFTYLIYDAKRIITKQLVHTKIINRNCS